MDFMERFLVSFKDKIQLASKMMKVRSEVLFVYFEFMYGSFKAVVLGLIL